MHDDTICIDGVKFSADKKTLIYFPESCPLREYTIPEGVTTIGRGAFYDAGVQSIVISDSMTKISKKAFLNCPCEKQLEKDHPSILDENDDDNDVYKILEEIFDMDPDVVE